MPNDYPEDIIDVIESDIADRLKGDDWFAKARLKEDGTYVSIPVLTEDLGNIDVMTADAVYQSGPGLVLRVQALEWDVQYKNVPGPYIEKLNITVLGIENVMFNRGTDAAPSTTGSLRKVKSTMLRVQELLHLWTPPSLSRALVCSEVKLARVGNGDDGDDGIVQYVALASAAAGTGIIPSQQVATPVVSFDGSLVTINCSTPGACICWNKATPPTKPVFPSPNPKVGTVYTGPFAASPGDMIYCNSWLTYYRTSQTVVQTL